jgi:hypothetical protein
MYTHKLKAVRRAVHTNRRNRTNVVSLNRMVLPFENISAKQ